MSSTGESSADVQREAETERAELVSTLDRLRENLKPENVIDEVLASARITPSDISDKVWQTARDNPIPATLIALGGAMLLGVGARVKGGIGRTEADAFNAGDSAPAADVRLDWSSNGGRGGRTAAPSAQYADDGRIASQLQAVGARAAASASKIASSVRSLRREAGRSSFKPAPARPTVNPVSGVHAMPTSSRSRDQMLGSLSRLLDEQPLVLAAVGVAIGAAIGAALPGTDAEGRLMGDASGSLKSRAQTLAQSELAHLKETASTTFDQLKQNAADRGLSRENLSGLVQDTGDTVRGAVGDVADHAANTAGLKS